VGEEEKEQRRTMNTMNREPDSESTRNKGFSTRALLCVVPRYLDIDCEKSLLGMYELNCASTEGETMNTNETGKKKSRSTCSY